MNCLEIEPYMFEPVCQSGESESNDSHADSDSDTDGDMYRGRAHQPVQLWCECTKCGPMPRDKECVRCQAWVDTLAKKRDVPCGVVRMLRHNIGFPRDSCSQGALFKHRGSQHGRLRDQ